MKKSMKKADDEEAPAMKAALVATRVFAIAIWTLLESVIRVESVSWNCGRP